jgi:pilus assembly protein CpaC
MGSLRAQGPGALPVIRPEDPRPADSFIESLRNNDAVVEVVVGQGRILTTKEDLTTGAAQPLIAVGDPSVAEFTVVNPKQIRVTGQRVGVTDLSITNAEGRNYNFEIHVVSDLSPLTAKLKSIFPDASLRLAQLRDHVVVEGQARDPAQVANILHTITAYLRSVQVGQSRRIQGQQAGGGGLPGSMPGVPAAPAAGPVDPGQAATPGAEGVPGVILPGTGAPLQIQGAVAEPQVINLIRVPGSQQVLLKVRVAELNRSALRRIGANFLGVDPDTGAIFGTQIAGPVTASGFVGNPVQLAPGRRLGGAAVSGLTQNSTVFGIFQSGDFEFTLNALRRNAMLKILAEPNLMAMHGYPASFLAGGEFPVPVPQVSSAGIAPTVTVQFKEFGVRLNFVPYILDGEVIRLSVAPEVSQIDFTIATTLVAGGTPVPGLNTRKAQTTVELRQGQTLAMAGLLQLQLDGSTDRVPGLGDLPIIGPFFSNTTSERIEKELVVLVTPYLVEPMNKEQVPPVPGDEVKEPNDLEFYFLNRIEGRTGKDFRSTTAWDDPMHLVPLLHLEPQYIHGPSGFSK